VGPTPAQQDTEGAATIRIARGTNAMDPDLLWHAAVIFAAVNDLPRATAELNLALKVKPELADRDDVKKLRQQLLLPTNSLQACAHFTRRSQWPGAGDMQRPTT
jgi:hypothetical protein